mmetsp:Transcript_21544/g.64299  ORF Transcript_21544/g.64299 Transcript_21544/m.64299 type:complete len:97 (+) Transcript_21544:62-352(+)
MVMVRWTSLAQALCLAVLCMASSAAAISGEGKSFFDVDWTDPSAAGMELAWRTMKVTMALSPLIAITLMFCCTKDDPEEEDLRRKKKFDFNLAGAE